MSTMAEVLVAHQRHRAGCLCGWNGLGRSLPDHQSEELTKAGCGKLADAWDEGHESGFWNGRDSAGNVEDLLIGAEHAREYNPYGSAS